MGNKNKVEVNIQGKLLTLISDESKDYMFEISEYLNYKMGQIKSSHADYIKALLLSINVADDLFKEREKNNSLQKEISRIKTDLAKANYKLKSYKKDK